MPDSSIAVPLEDWIDPAALFATWIAHLPHAFWLDAGPDAAAGWSWLGIGEPDAERTVLATELARPGAPTADAGPFRGGWVGWCGYEPGAQAAGAPIDADELAPPSVWLRTERLIAFDHATRRAWAVSRGDERWADQVRERARVLPRNRELPEPAVREAVGRHEPDEYAVLIERCRDAIRDGDAYQLCLTTRFSVDGEVEPASVYLRLRNLTPSHHGGYIRSEEIALLSASPERFLEVGDGMVRTRPIKGTRPRGADAVADARLADELVTSEKERAENVMIVDLMRNDLSRVCAPGSVGVTDLLVVESYPAVHQLVSMVTGRLVDGTTVGGLLDAAFPAGSMTGAPKLSAMTILHRLEGGPRGIFAGAFGWVGHDGALDLAMVIRSIVVHHGGAYVGAGGGITWRSDAAAEVAEVGIKARGPLAALGAALPPGW